eukprot:2111005-Amphidinium_carterae.1
MHPQNADSEAALGNDIQQHKTNAIPLRGIDKLEALEADGPPEWKAHPRDPDQKNQPGKAFW